MPYTEFLGWMIYYNKRPKGWREEYNTFQIMRSFGLEKNVKPWDVFPNLYKIFNEENESKKPVDTLKGSALFQFISRAKGGDSIDVIDNQS